jgi:hypothetical protein
MQPRPPTKQSAKAHDKVAINVYQVIDQMKPIIDGRYELKYHKIELKSPLLLSALELILKKEDILVHEDKALEISEPFRPLYFCYTDIVAKHKALDGSKAAKPLLALLIQLLDKVLAPVWQKTRQLRAKRMVSFDAAWAFYQRGSPVISQDKGCELISKVSTTLVKGSGSQAKMLIMCKLLRFNGKEFAWEDTEWDVPFFEGDIPIHDLDHIPLDFYQEAAMVAERTSARGRRVLDYQGVSHKRYQGFAWFEDLGTSQKYHVSILCGNIPIAVEEADTSGR